jgi:hypothetical protein
VSLEEVLSFECARRVAAISPEDHQIGPVFQRAGIVVTSIGAASGERFLIINGGAGVYSARLLGVGVNRIRFSVPTNVATAPRTYFLAYLHGGSADSRMFELAPEQPPSGREETDYLEVTLARAENLLPHFEYNIYETVEQTLHQITNRRIGRGELGSSTPDVCDHITRKSPSLGRTLRYDLEMIADFVRGPKTRAGSVALNRSMGGRAPASLPPN